VAGERRFRASCTIDLKGSIPSIVKELSEDEAFEFMIIENLQREDLTEMEEAQSFKEFVDRKGAESIPELSDRTGIRAGYIRRRIAVIGLPGYILKAWEKGKLKYGHLEQFLRVKSKDKLKALYEYAAGITRYMPASVKDLKEKIEEMAPALHHAFFDMEKEGCIKCPLNSKVQKSLWDIGDLKRAHCLDPNCFKKKQNNYLNAHWKETALYEKFKTNGFRFEENVQWGDYHLFYDWELKPTKKCESCPHFLTIINTLGEPGRGEGRACFDRSCYDARVREKEKKKKEKEAGQKDEDSPRVDWHGRHFREEFFKVRIPERFEEWHREGKHSAHLMLIALLKSNRDLKNDWFGKKMKIKDDGCYIPSDKLFKFVFPMTMETTIEVIRQASLKVIMQSEFGAEARWLIADYLGIDLGKEFSVTQEYLEKKTIKEMLKFGNKSALFETKECKDYLEKLGKKAFDKLKKTELIDVFLKSGIDLAGKVPAEITERK